MKCVCECVNVKCVCDVIIFFIRGVINEKRLVEKRDGGGVVDDDAGKCERHGGGPLLLLLCCAVDGDDVCVCDGVGWVVDEDDKRALVEDGWFVVRSVSAVRSDE